MNTNYPLPSKHPLIQASLDAGVLTLTMGIGQAPAALDVPAIESLDQIMCQLTQDTEVRVLVLRGRGRNFGQGLDIQAIEQMHAEDPKRVQHALTIVRHWGDGQLRCLPQPVLAIVQGQCAGAAITLVQGCDLALCDHDAQFRFEERDARWLALKPSAQNRFDGLLARALNYHYLSGLPANGQQAEHMGLVTFSHPADILEHEVSQLVASLCAKDSLALQFTKQTLVEVGSMSWDAAVNYTSAKFAEIKARQAEGPSTRATAIAGFLAGKNKPGLGG